MEGGGLNEISADQRQQVDINKAQSEQHLPLLHIIKIDRFIGLLEHIFEEHDAVGRALRIVDPAPAPVDAHCPADSERLLRPGEMAPGCCPVIGSLPVEDGLTCSGAEACDKHYRSRSRSDNRIYGCPVPRAQSIFRGDDENRSLPRGQLLQSRLKVRAAADHEVAQGRDGLGPGIVGHRLNASRGQLEEAEVKLFTGQQRSIDLDPGVVMFEVDHNICHSARFSGDQVERILEGESGFVIPGACRRKTVLENPQRIKVTTLRRRPFQKSLAK